MYRITTDKELKNPIESLISIQINDDLENAADECVFTCMTKNISQYFVNNEIMAKHIYLSNDEIDAKARHFIIQSISIQGDISTVSAAGSGYYLNQYKITDEIKNLEATASIKKLCNDYNLNTGIMPEATDLIINYMIHDTPFFTVLKNIVKFAQLKGEFENMFISCSEKEFNLKEYEKLPELETTIAGAIKLCSVDTIHELSTTISVEKLRNNIIYTDENGERKTLQDGLSDKRYGSLQALYQLDIEDKKPLEGALNMLNKLNVILKTYKLKMLGDFTIRNGVIIPINQPDYGLEGKFLVTKSAHSISGTTDIVTLHLSKV